MDNSRNHLDEEEPDGVTEPLADDEFYRALAARPRRRVLAHLLERGESEIDELAAVLAGWEATEDRTASREQYDRIRVELFHTHLPFLAETGLVTYHRDDGRVVLGDVAAPVRDLVRRSIEAENG